MRWGIGCVCVSMLLWSASGQEKSQAELAKLPMWQRMLKGEDAKKAAKLHEKLGYAVQAEQWDEASKLVEQQIAFRTAQQGADHWEVSNTRQLLKQVEIERKLTREERKQLAETYELFHQIVESYEQSQFQKALQLSQHVIEIRQKLLGEQHPEYAGSLNYLAGMYQGMGENANAIPLCLQTLKLYKSHLGEQHPYYAASLDNLVVLYRSMGEYAKAEPLLVQVLDLNKVLYGEQHPEFVGSLNRLAQLYQEMEDYAKAEPLYLQSRDLAKSRYEESHPFQFTSLNNLAGLYHVMGDYAKAEPLYLQARDLIKTLFEENDPYYVSSLNNLAGLYLDMGDYDKAKPLYLQVRELRERFLGDNHPDYALSLNNLAALHYRMGEARTAEQLLLACCRSYEMSHLARATGFQWPIGVESTSPYFLLATISARLGKPRAAYEAVERNLALAHYDVQVRHRGTTLSAEQQARHARIVNTLSPIDELITALADRIQPTPEETRQLDLLINQRDKLNGELADLAAELNTQEVSDFASIQNAIPASHVLLTWLDIASKDGKVQEHFACVVRREGEPFWVRLPGAGEQGKWTKDDTELPIKLREALAQSVPSSNAADLIQQLRKQRIEPVLAYLQKHQITQLYVVGVNQMAGIPIEVLAPEFTVSYVPSGTFLARLPKKPNFENTLLAVGDPIYEVEKPRPTKDQYAGLGRGDEFSDLPGTRYEVTRLRQLFPSSQVLLDSQASERSLDALRRSGELGKFRYLHFATHGKANNVQAFESKLVLSQDQPKELLAKPGEPWFNNEVSAREVLDFWKLNADLVTLSACETAIGRQGGGDGLLGFAQAFLLAGSRSVCLSLWEVDDTATALLMQRFYQNLLGKRDGLPAPMPKAKALEEAKQWLRNLTAAEVTTLTAQLTEGISRGTRGEKKVVKSDIPLSVKPDDKPYAHPHYWSAFILLGEAE